MEIYNTLGWVLIVLVGFGVLFTGPKGLLDIRAILGLAWGIFLVWRY